MGARAQNIMIVRGIQSVIVSNEDIRAEDLYYNLIAAPGYVEAIDEMLVLNEDRKETAFVVGDTPFTLAANGTSLQNWATNKANTFGNNEFGLISASKYFACWYPSGLSTNVDGTDVVVPPSHMALRTIAYNDQVAYPWFAPAGLQRGIVNNAASVGYVNAEGQFIPTKLNEGQRDILYINGINPIRVMPQGGIVVFGQKTRQPYSSATDRINVVRLENYLRYQLNLLAQPFLFEPNDSITRKAVKDAFDRFLAELITLRALYDFLVVCDLSNNTPARIDRNELWIDIAIQPVKAIEFIYIPIRIKNTGSDLSLP
jgi:phage tail sheath protein FI